MTVYLGDFAEDATIDLMWSTNDRNGASVSPTVAGEIRVYKDNGVAESLAGITDARDFDTDQIGIHALTIDLSADAFYAIGSNYTVVLNGATIDGQAVNAVLAHFSIENQGVAVAKAVWDRVLTGATHNIATSAGRRLRTLQDFGLYEGGAIWIDTVNGVAGTTDFENGTVNNPVDSIEDALTLAASVGLDAFQVLPGSSINLGSEVLDGFEFRGFSYTVTLSSQSISGTKFIGATIVGNDSGSNAVATVYENCDMGSNTLGAHILQGCRLTGDIVLAEAADYFWDQCFSGMAGTGTPSVDFESAAETKNLSIRHYSGGMEFKNHGAGGGTHTTSIEGFGQIVLNASCAGGTIAVRGNFTITDNAGDVVTLSDDARVEVTHRMAADMEAIAGATDSAANLDASAEVIVRGTVDTATNGHSPTATEFQADDITEPETNAYNGRVVIFRDGDLIRQATVITGYQLVGGIGQFTVEAFTDAPADDDTFVIV